MPDLAGHLIRYSLNDLLLLLDLEHPAQDESQKTRASDNDYLHVPDTSLCLSKQGNPQQDHDNRNKEHDEPDGTKTGEHQAQPERNGILRFETARQTHFSHQPAVKTGSAREFPKRRTPLGCLLLPVYTASGSLVTKIFRTAEKVYLPCLRGKPAWADGKPFCREIFFIFRQ